MNTPADNTQPAALEGRKQEWNITRILVGHDSNHGPIPEIGVLISSIERYNRDHHALLLAQNAEMRACLEELLFAFENADETGYVTDVGFIKGFEQLPDRCRAALSRNGGKV